MYRWGIRHQVLLLAIIPTLIVSILLVSYFTSTRLQDLEQSFQERGEAIALKLAPAGEYGVFSRNAALLQNLANATLKEHDVKSVTFYTEKGVEITSAGHKYSDFRAPVTENLSTDIFKKERGPILEIVVPITSYQEIDTTHSDQSKMETLIGWLKVELDSTPIRLREYQVLLHTGIILLFGLSISGLHALKMGRNVTRPILELSEAVKRIKNGDFSTRVQTSAYRELKTLESGINTMAQALDNAHAELQSRVEEATGHLRRSLETIEVQNLELEIAKQVAETANKIKSEFLADMSHEIRTPLNAVIGFIHLLRRTDLNAKQQEYIQTLHKSGSTLLSIINDILDFSKIEAGKLQIEQSPMNIRDTVDEILTLLTPHADEKNVHLIPLIYTDVPQQIMCDPLRIKQVLTNLVGNAVKFTEEGSIVVRVMLEEETERDMILCLSVTDTGLGLTESEQQTLFQAFSQANVETTRKFGGTGLGLVISKKLVEQMNGSIGVESTPNKGTTFWFTVQAKKIKQLKQVTAIRAESHSLEMFDSARVMAVDDNPDNLKLIVALLQEMKVDVLAVSSGIEALKVIKKMDQSFDLILMDIRMPEMDGIETTHAIRQFETIAGLNPTPIVALTAHAFISERDSLLQVGIDDYLMKPLDERALMTLLRKWTQKKDAPKIIDWDLAYTLAAGKKDLAHELFEKLEQGLPNEQAQINRAFEQRNWKNLRDHVHRLHGACCYCGVPELKKSAQKLESAIATETANIIKPRLDALNTSIAAVLAESACAV